MMGRKAAVLLALLVASTLAGWWLTTWATPRLIMRVATERLIERAGDSNRMVHAPPASPGHREVVRPSPDLLYSACAFDLSEGDVIVRIGATDGYWSASFYDGATNNFRIVSHRGLGPGDQVLRLTRKGLAGPETVVSPNEEGVVLIRRRIDDRAALALARQAQDKDECEVVR